MNARTGGRFCCSALTLGIAVSSLVSNIVLRLGFIDYNITITFWFIVPFAFYVLLILAYLNVTDISISLIDKIIMGTLAMFVVAALTFSMILDRNRLAQYEQHKDQAVLFMLTGSDYRPPDLRYHSVWNANRETMLYATRGTAPGTVPPIDDARFHIVRPAVNSREHYIAFRRVYDGRVHEFGFSYRSFREYMAPSPGILLAVVAAMLLMIFYGSKIIYRYTLTRPLRKMTDALRKVERGDQQVYIPVRTHDELGFLSHAINAMTGQIRDYTNYLEAMVDDRTRELNEMNQNLVETTYKLAHAQRIAERDMKMAINIQRSLLPQTPPRSSDWDCAFHYQPMSGISGDAYDFYVREGKLAGAGIFDISGHGIASALIAVITRTIMGRSFSQMQRRKSAQSCRRPTVS